MFILIRDTHHRHAISLRPGVVVYVRVVVLCEGYPYSDQHPARRRLSLLLSRSRQQESPSLLRPAQRSRHYTPSRPSETMQTLASTVQTTPHFFTGRDPRKHGWQPWRGARLRQDQDGSTGKFVADTRAPSSLRWARCGRTPPKSYATACGQDSAHAPLLANTHPMNCVSP